MAFWMDSREIFPRLLEITSARLPKCSIFSFRLTSSLPPMSISAMSLSGRCGTSCSASSRVALAEASRPGAPGPKSRLGRGVIARFWVWSSSTRFSANSARPSQTTALLASFSRARISWSISSRSFEA